MKGLFAGHRGRVVAGRCSSTACGGWPRVGELLGDAQGAAGRRALPDLHRVLRHQSTAVRRSWPSASPRSCSPTRCGGSPGSSEHDELMRSISAGPLVRFTQPDAAPVAAVPDGRPEDRRCRRRDHRHHRPVLRRLGSPRWAPTSGGSRPTCTRSRCGRRSLMSCLLGLLVFAVVAAARPPPAALAPVAPLTTFRRPALPLHYQPPNTEVNPMKSSIGLRACLALVLGGLGGARDASDSTSSFGGGHRPPRHERCHRSDRHDGRPTAGDAGGGELAPR